MQTGTVTVDTVFARRVTAESFSADCTVTTVVGLTDLLRIVHVTTQCTFVFHEIAVEQSCGGHATANGFN